ncbi:ATP-binding protein [Streptomyces fuscigenes]|uniref:ATP-binding protein n=1 Tax=Streptomyces fuscigenes TaxID=1528880 RepID=UPI001F449E64|nr:ATP-binding protein [Streptomyces fuscigenes]MCF3962884.1 ATP-binding protein [Streptomyces fuscigenes]
MNPTTEAPAVRERYYRRERRSVPAARRFAADALTSWGLAGRADEVLLCVSELTTNALLHGAPPGRGFRLFLTHAGTELRVEVHDSGGGRPARRSDGGGGDGPGLDAPPDAECGRGLLLVDALADAWGVGERDPGKIVWCLWRL